MMTDRRNGDDLPDPERRNGDERVTDAELIQHLDGELSGAARVSLEARIAASPEASARLAELRSRSEKLSSLLVRVDPSDARRRESASRIRGHMTDGGRAGAQPDVRPVWPLSLRAAAVVAFLVATAFAVPPARAWMVERAQELAQALGFASTPAPQERDADTAGADIAVSFTVSGESFDIHVPGAAGVLIIFGSEGSSGTAEAESASGGPAPPGVGFLVLPEGLRIEGAAPDGVYRVAVPRTVTSLLVRAGDRPVIIHPRPADDETLRIELDG